MDKKAVDRLPDKCKEIFILNRFEDLTYEEIATKLNISQNTVRVQIFRALDMLRVFINKNLS
ncbi:MAG: sigma-70 family RNA polymerase sigma factor [Bacteroidetes bacterium]|nr:sigma-70 family RNA polymerase sigma factor [Bacteroidota bacterium]